jgi:hypothetical protein
MLSLEEVIQYVPYTRLKLVTPLLMEANYLSTIKGYNREQSIKHFESKYVQKQPDILPSRYNIQVKD